MSPLSYFSEPPWQRLALAMLHFLWQGTAVALLLIAVTRVLKLRAGPPRYGAQLLALLAMAAAPIITFLVLESP